MSSVDQDRKVLLFPEVLQYLQARERESALIPPERRVELRTIQDYIRSQQQLGRPALLTFICTHNSRRSHLSQIWAQVAADYYGQPGVQTFSGGTEATALNPRAVVALRAAGLQVEAGDSTSQNPHYQVRASATLPAQECFSKVFNAPPNPQEGYCAVMTCSHADENCPVAMGCVVRVAVRYEDPKEADGTPSEAMRYLERSAQICREMLWLMNFPPGTP